MNPLLLVLAISLAANGALGWVYLGARDDVVAAKKDADAAKGAAETCSSAVDQLQIKAAANAKKFAKDLKAAQSKADTGDKKADEILATPATVPGDDCKSAQDRVDTWLAGRVKP